MIRKMQMGRDLLDSWPAGFGLLCVLLAASITPRAMAQPVNDLFVNATTLVGGTGSAFGNNLNATLEPLDPVFVGGPPLFPFGGASIWYRWVAPTNGTVIFDTFGSRDSFGFFELDTTLGGYEGTNLTGLFPLAFDDDVFLPNGFFTFNSLISFFASAGTEYRIEVAGFSTFDQGFVTLNWNQAAATNAPPPPLVTNGIQFASATYTVGEERPGYATIDVVFGGGAPGTVTIDYSTSGGSAIDGVDYIGRSGTLTFAFGETNKSFTVPIIDNANINSNLTIQLTLRNPVGAVLGTLTNALLTVIDDETIPFVSTAGHFQFTTNLYEVTEFETFEYPCFNLPPSTNRHSVKGVMVTVNRVGGSTGRVLVDYATVDTTNFVFTNIFFTNIFSPFFFNRPAVPGWDYQPTRGTLVFDDFQTSTNFVIPVSSDFYNFLRATNAFPFFGFGFNFISNGNALVQVTLSNPRPAPEEDPALIVPTLSASNTSATVQVTEIDSWVGFSFERRRYRVDESGTNALVDVILNPGGPGTVRVAPVLIRQGSAISYASSIIEAGSDNAEWFPQIDRNFPYGPNPPYTDGATNIPFNLDFFWGGTNLVFAPGECRKTVVIPINNDNIAEFNEDVIIALIQLGGNPLVNPQSDLSTLTILYDDQPSGAADRNWNPEEVAFTQPPFNLNPGANGPVNGVAVQDDQKSIIVGDFTAYNAVRNNGIARLNNDGSLDASFGTGLGANGPVSDVGVYPSLVTNQALVGKIIVVGSFKSIDGVERYGIARLNTNGTLDASFNPGSGTLEGISNPGSGEVGAIRSVALQNDGKIVIVGDFIRYNGIDRNGIARINPDGSLDTTFDPGTGANGTVWSVALLETAPPILTGAGTAGGPAEDINSVDTGGRQGTITVTANFYQVPDQMRIYYEGTRIFDTGLIGTPDGFTPFITNFSVNFGPGQSTIVTIIMNEGSGLFGTIWDYTASILTIGADKKMMIGGEFTEINGISINGVARLNPSGSLDTSFNPGGGVDGPVYALGVQNDNKVVIGGGFNTVDFRNRKSIARLNADGSLDETYEIGSGFDDAVFAIKLDVEGKALVGGPFTMYNGTRRVGYARLFTYGALDSGFMDTAYNQFAGLINPFSFEPRNFVNAFGIESSGNIIIGGSFTNLGGHAHPLFNEGYLDPERVALSNHFSYTPVWTRQDKSSRYNVARVIGGRTPASGNIEFKFQQYTADEHAGSLLVAIRRTDGRIGTITADVATSNRLAEAGQDFPLGKSTIVWPENAYETYPMPHSVGLIATNYYRLNITEDTLIEGDEILDLAMFNIMGSVNLGGEIITTTPARSRATVPVTIIDNDFPVGTLTFASTSYATNENAGTNLISVIRTNGSHGSVTVSWSLRTGTALAGVDFANVSGTLFFGQGQTNAVIAVPLIDDLAVEIDEVFTIVLSNPTGGATLAGGASTLTSSGVIIDNDLQPNSGRVNFGLAGFVTNESSGFAVISVRRLNGSGGPLRVQAAATSGTAIAGVDFIGVTNTLSWTAGDISTRTFLVPLINDGLVEPDETVNLRLFSPVPTNGLGGQSTATLTIRNDNFFGAFSFSSPVYDANENGTNATITVVRVGGVAEDVFVDYLIQDGTAINGVDYLGESGTLHFGPGQVSQSFVISVLNNDIPDGDRTVDLRLANIVNGSTGLVSVARLNIIDDESFNVPAGSLDSTFSLQASANSAVYALALQDDGKIILGGDFRTVNRVTRNRIARLTAGGLLDASFNVGQGPNRTVRTMVLQPDGRIIIGGFFDRVHGTNRNRIARLLADGSLDSFFNPGSGANNPVYAAALAAEGRVVIGGSFTSFDGISRPGVALLNPDGSLNTGFNPGLGANGTVFAVAVQNDGKILIGGDFAAVQDISRPRLARLNANGTLDQTFNPGLGPNDVVRALTLQPDGGILVGGSFTSVNGTNRNGLARLFADGSLDASFLASAGDGSLDGANGAVYAIALQPDNGILVVGDFTTFNGVTRNRITRLTFNGKTDPTINFGEGANSFIGAVVVQPDRRIVIAGGFTMVQGEARNYVARLYGGSIAGPGSLTFSAPTYSRVENGGEATIVVHRTGGTTGDVGVDFQTSDGTATSFADYLPVSGTLFFPEGEVRLTFTVPLIDDLAIEPDETVELTLLNLDGGAILGDFPTATLTILSDDSVISFLTSTNVVNENAVAGYAPITVVRLGTTNASVSVDYLSSGGTATPGLDYTNVSDTLTFLPGETLKTFNVPVSNDSLVEGTETVQLFLTNVTSGGQLGIATSILRIVDDEFAPGRLQFSSPVYTVNEYETNIVITVIRTNGSSGIVEVEYNTINGSAQAGNNTNDDYLAASGTLTFPDGETVRTFSIAINPDYNSSETNETVIIVLSAPKNGAVLGSPTTATLTILNNNLVNGAFSFTATNYTVVENNLVAVLRVSRSFGALGPVSVGYRTVAGTAIPVADYDPVTNVLTWVNGESATKSIPIFITDDSIVEGTETFAVELFNPTGAAVLGARPRATVTVLDEDVGPGYVGFALTNFFVVENATNAVITINRTFGHSGVVSIELSTISGGTAVPGLDYAPTNVTLTFLDNETNKVFLLPVLNNFIVEGNKTIRLLLSNPQGGVSTNGQSVAAVVTIVEDEQPAGSIDASFNNAGANLPVNVIVIQTNNNKLVVGGDFTTFSGLPRNHLVRLNLSGSVDTTFDPLAVLGTTNSTVRALAAFNDGRVLVGGVFANNTNRLTYLMRLAADGLQDTNFLSGLAGPDNIVDAIALQADGRFLIGGSFATVNNTNRSRIARLEFNGVIDPSFNPGGGANGDIHAIIVQSDGKIVAAGDFTTFNGVPFNRIVRLNPNGSIDNTFTPGVGFDSSVRSMVQQAVTGRLIVGGYFTSYDGVPRSGVARLNSNGSLDTTFLPDSLTFPGTGANEFVTSVALQPDGKIVVGGAFTEFNGVQRNRLVRLNPNGSVDYTINIGSGANNYISTVAIQSDRKIVFGGGFTEFNGAPRRYIARIAGGDNYGYGEFAFSSPTYTVSENGTNLIVTVRRLVGSSNTVSVAYSTADGSALAFVHYLPTSGVLTFGPGDTVATFEVAVTDDLSTNVDRSFLVVLSNPTGGATLGEPHVATVTVVNDDSSLGFAVDSFSVSESDSIAVIPVLRLGSTVGSVLVDFATTPDGTATEFLDYVPVSGTIIFTNGQSEAFFVVPILGDALIEGNETLGLVLRDQNPSYPAGNASIDTPTATLTIVDDDFGIGVVGFASALYTVSERGTNAVITVVRLGGSSGQASVQFATSMIITNGALRTNAALAGVDYLSTNGLLVFGDGQSVKTFTVPIIDDALVEGFEDIRLTLFNAIGPSLGLSNAVLRIRPDESVFSFNPQDYSVIEGNTNVIITVSRSRDGTGPVSVDFATLDGTATAALDYGATNGTLVFAPGVFTQTITVPVYADGLGEGNEFFSVALFNPGGESTTTGGTNVATVTIIDNDISFSFSQESYLVGEASGSASIAIRRTGQTNGVVSVQFVASDGSATAGLDFGFTNVTVVFGDGETLRLVGVAIIDDGVGEGNETVNLSLFNPTNGTSLGLPSSAVLTIIDNEDTLRFGAPTYIVSEDGTSAILTVVRGGAATNSLTVQYATTNGTAIAGLDYTAVSGVLSFQFFETFKTISIPILNDSVVELDETFTVNLFNASFGSTLLSPSSAVVTITEEDANVSFAIPAFTVSESGTNALITILRGGNSTATNQVRFFTTNGTATAGVDYGATNVVLTFLPGETVRFIAIPIFDDLRIEGQETVELRLVSAVNAVLGANSVSTLTILDNDASTLVAAGAALISESQVPANGQIDPGETVSINFGMRNVGNVDTVNLIATLVTSNGVTAPSAPQSYGVVAAGGATVARPFSFTAVGTNGGLLIATFRLQDGANVLGFVSFPFTIGRASGYFANNTGITINDSAVATPYPATNIVSGVSGTLTKVTVTLQNLTHTFPDDLDILLVGPNGARAVLMSDAGSSSNEKFPLNNVTVTFDDFAPVPIPDSNQIASATYRPANYASGSFTGDSFPTLPPPFTNASLAVFNGINPNGVWKLYVVDDASGDAGNIAGGWSLAITTTDTIVAPADLSVDGSDSPDPVNSGTNLIYTILVVNNGPATANNVMVTNVLPAGITYESAITTAGSCTPIGGQVVCNLGSLASGGSATVTLTTMATMLGTHTAVVSAFSSTPDLNTNNNIATIKTSVSALALRLVQVNNQSVLRWLAPATGYVLQQSTGLHGGAWVNVPGTPTVVNGEKTMVINVTNVARFYRLKAP